ncbi:MAG: outer membrane beta-barrel protein [Bacteroidia bacterium]|nr:outer membrane beta-barrel protein [Bacteroidia bacterium]
MKKIILFSVAALGCISAEAQTEQGKILLGGSVSYSSNKNTYKETVAPNTVETNKYKSSSFGFEPTIGYFLADNIAVGIYAGINSSKSTFSYENGPYKERTDKYSTTSFGLFARKYFMVVPTFGFYAGLTAGVGPNKNTETTVPNVGTTTIVEYKGSSFNAGLNCGVAFFPTPKVGLHLGIGGLGYNSSKLKGDQSTGDGENKYSNFNFNLNTVSLNLGLYLFLGGNG